MKRVSDPYFSVEQLNKLADAKYAEAATMPEGPYREALLGAAQNLADRARVKNWVLQELQKFPSRAYH